MAALALSFHEVQFDIIDHNGQPWLRVHQIGEALEYANPNRSMINLYNANADEFTDAMTALVELETNGGKQQVRIFSLRGCHLLAMLARTQVAKEFRRWVLDILDHETGAPTNPRFRPEKTRQALPGGLTIEQQDAIKALVKSRVEVLPVEAQAGAAIKCWSSIKSKFGCGYKEIPADQFTNVLSLVVRLPLENDSTPPFLQGEFGARFLIQLAGGGRYSVTPIAVTEIVVDLADLIAIDEALDTWRAFAKKKELGFYREGMAKRQATQPPLAL